MTPILLLLLACGDPKPETPAPEQVPSPAPAAGHVATDALGWLGSVSQGVGHCSASERALFSCEVEGPKHISLCSDDTLDALQYRFGPLGTPELAAPASSAVSAFSSAHTAWASGQEHSVWLSNQGVVYRLVSAAGSGIDGASNNYSGVRILQAGRELGFVQCANGAAVDHLNMLGPWLSDKTR